MNFEVGQCYIGDAVGQLFVLEIARITKEDISYRYWWAFDGMLNQGIKGCLGSSPPDPEIWDRMDLVLISKEKKDCLTSLWTSR